MKTQTKFQIGKNGITEGVIDSLSLAFKNHKQVRISMLKSSGRDRNSIQVITQEIIRRLESKTNHKFTFNIIGFTSILTRHPGR